MARRSSRKVISFDDRQVRKYLNQLDRDSKRKTIFAVASAKAGIPIRKTARKEAKKSLTHERVKANRPLAKFNDRVAALRKAGYKVRDRKKKTINLIRVKRGKRKYRGSAWIVGGPFANLVHHNKGRRVIKAKKGKAFPIALKSGEVLFVNSIRTPRKNAYLDKAFDRNKASVKRIFKKEVGIAVRKHAAKYGNKGSKNVKKLLR